DTELLELLCAVACKQRQLLDGHFSWTERKCLPAERRTLFRAGKSRNRVYEKLLTELDALKTQVLQHRRKMGYASGTFWWTLPWEQIRDYLIYDLSWETEAKGWRFERNIRTAPMDDGNIMLVLSEEGHCSSFSSNTTFETGILSDYSADEINSKMRDFNHRANAYELSALALNGDARVHSSLTGAEYDSTASYLLSAEHYTVRSYHRDALAKSLYTNTETTTVHAVSHSQHYKTFYFLGRLGIAPGGRLERLEVLNYKCSPVQGNVPAEMLDIYRGKDAAVECAAFLSDYADVKSVPLELFGKALNQSSVDFEETLRQAEICTCLAGKLSV
ncbi:MAG: hypothetical protein LUH07_03765, partial [Lachnospiraceae bacterium]|nr:hypothetical protein [Lachnospiraceae bacterium]